VVASEGADLDAAGEEAWTGARWSGHLRTVSVGGRRIRFLDVGEGPTIVLVHGLGASWQVWYRNIADLAADHRVVAVDLPGFGRSEALDGMSGLLRYAETLQTLLDSADVDDALVVGHSLGGLIVQRLAEWCPERVAGLMIVSSGDGIVAARQQAVFRGLALASTMVRRFGPPAFLLDPVMRGLLSFAPLRHRLLSRVVHDPAGIPPQLAGFMMASVLRSPALADAIRAGLRGDVEPSHIRCPTVVLAGDRDRMVPELAGRRLAAAIPLARFELGENVGHHPMLERPTAFNNRLRTFSTEVLRAS
jgi:pimeloyl-ACP methyl ester carboxylesterase